MTRFHITTILILLILLLEYLFISGTARWLLLTVTAACYLVIFTLGVTFIRLRFFCPSLCRITPGGNQVALTFDDGPDPRATPILLDTLQRLKVTANFFCIGRNILAPPQLTRRIQSDGHLLANHTFKHAWWTNFLFGQKLFTEIQRSQQAIQDTTGTCSPFFRSPVGLTNPHFPALLRRTGLTLVGWDVRGLDRNANNPRAVVDRVLKNTRPGSIILLHDGGADPSVLNNIVEGIIIQLRSRGLTFARLDNLLSENPTSHAEIDH